MAEDLLPPNASEEERALSTSISRAADVPVVAGDMWNPLTAPEATLPWLAWAFSVDRWNPAWPVSVKRATIARAASVHRQKGTLAGVRRALEGLGVSAEVVEWWQETPKGAPYTFTLTALANENLGADSVLLTQEGHQSIVDAVTAAKNLRSHFTLRMGGLFGAGVALASGAMAFNRLDAKGAFKAFSSSVSPLVLAGATHAAPRLKARGTAQTK
ncbi:phage tail protein I [Terasakiella sp.]|uniref:phage tail protein I n=1 Tax=Terasakiella sp. TaxID=2034861 RepID=UPI003AA8A437